MDDQKVRQILKQIADGNTVFDTNSTEVANALGYSVEVEQSEEEAANLRYHLDALGQRGFIRIVAVSTANSYTVDLTPQGREVLRRLGE